MRIYMAPLEGITGYIFRNAFEKCFGGVDRYYAPFIDARLKRSLKSKELRDLMPENNPGVMLVPQIMTNNAEAFLKTEEEMRGIGYELLNLNLGCPSRTVVSKGRGAGFLEDPRELRKFFDAIFSVRDVRLSVKTRIGIDSPNEMEDLLKVYNEFPIEELIVHPRVQQDFYKNTPNWEVFGEVLRESRAPVCYNGDIFTVEDARRFAGRFPECKTLMLGRGLLRNPALARMLREEEAHRKNPADGFSGRGCAALEEWKQLHDRIYQAYREFLSGEKPVLFKMKELWFYWMPAFGNEEKLSKQMKKVQHLTEYERIVEGILTSSRKS